MSISMEQLQEIPSDPSLEVLCGALAAQKSGLVIGRPLAARGVSS
jgi:hypothetical protein